jgi:AcrR family transcriptional regulator
MTRATLLPLLAAHVLEHGIAGLTLRPLARAVGTSDRMLLYHFGTKEKLLTELLDHISASFVTALEAILPRGRLRSRAACLEALSAATRGERFRPYLALWWQLVAGAAQGDLTARAAAGAIMDQLLGWVEELLPLTDPEPGQAARHILTLIEGAQMLDAVGRPEIADVALAGLPPAP